MTIYSGPLNLTSVQPRSSTSSCQLLWFITLQSPAKDWTGEPVSHEVSWDELTVSFRTDKSLDVILAYALNTGILASFFSLTCPIVYSLMPDNLVFLCLRIILTGLYVNSLLAMLNARYYFQKSDDLSTGPINAPSQTSVLVYNGRGFNRQLHSTASSSSNKATINEIGLPLFQPREERNKVDSSIQLMEVKVTKDRLDVA
ncbi:hypothetical protein Moror_11372 [Moniliophthora roreri MCA 2997]|uniref:DUF6534 domain-containing protein n=1 Tax=Moniliophthora roreri (strain MCA 2997) TaxID=1381753 RepID=V2WYJ6_MONRO|nr:hypothetical protein Moror_11372 [Moniliophthora roreri MCA 2997]